MKDPIQIELNFVYDYDNALDVQEVKIRTLCTSNRSKLCNNVM